MNRKIDGHNLKVLLMGVAALVLSGVAFLISGARDSGNTLFGVAIVLLAMVRTD